MVRDARTQAERVASRRSCNIFSGLRTKVKVLLCLQHFMIVGWLKEVMYKLKVLE